MSGGAACRNPEHRPQWRVIARNGNFSAFNGYRWTPSDYSELKCRACGAIWRTKARYVSTIPSGA